MLGLMLKPSIAWSTRTTRTTVNGAKVVVFFDKCSLYYCASERGRLCWSRQAWVGRTWGPTDNLTQWEAVPKHSTCSWKSLENPLDPLTPWTNQRLAVTSPLHLRSWGAHPRGVNRPISDWRLRIRYVSVSEELVTPQLIAWLLLPCHHSKKK